MPQRALITGATGLLGRQVVTALERAGYDVVGIGFNRASPPKILKVDIQNSEQLDKLFDKVQPDIVVHCAAERRPEAVTNNPEAAHRLNVLSTEELARKSEKGLMIYISTDYVFPGVRGQAPYKTTDQPKPTNTYGETKLYGEQAVLRTSHNAVILRVPVLYGPTEPHDNNQESAVNILMDSLYQSQKEKVKMDNWATRYPTNTEDVGRVCAAIAKLYTTQDPQKLPRILHFSSEDRMTKYEICEKFSEIMGLPMDGLVPDEDGGKPDASGTLRPYDCHLDTSELKKLGVDVSTQDFVAWWRRKVGAFRR